MVFGAPDAVSTGPVVYACGVRDGDGTAAQMEVRADSERGFSLEVVHVSGPGDGGGHCSAPSYPIAEEATRLELGAGTYTITAKAERKVNPLAFPVTGRVTVEPNHCYVPAMSCDGDVPDGAACHLRLAPSTCRSRGYLRRVVVRGARYC